MTGRDGKALLVSAGMWVTIVSAVIGASCIVSALLLPLGESRIVWVSFLFTVALVAKFVMLFGISLLVIGVFISRSNK